MSYDDSWKKTMHHAVSVFSFIIRGEGEMSGRKFAEHIRNYCGSSTEELKEMISVVENHVVKIYSNYAGTKFWWV